MGVPGISPGHHREARGRPSYVCLAHSGHIWVIHQGSLPSQTPGLGSLQAQTPLPAGPSGDTPKFKNCGFMFVSRRPQEAGSCPACSQRRNLPSSVCPVGPLHGKPDLAASGQGVWCQSGLLVEPGMNRTPSHFLWAGRGAPILPSWGGANCTGVGEGPLARTSPTHLLPERSSLGAEGAAAYVGDPCKPQVSPWATTMLPPRLTSKLSRL